LSDARRGFLKRSSCLRRGKTLRGGNSTLSFFAMNSRRPTPHEGPGKYIRPTITRVITQCSEHYRDGKFRIDFHRRAMQSEHWAADFAARADGDDHIFTQFYNHVGTHLTLATQNKTLTNGSALAPLSSPGQLTVPRFYGERATVTLHI
jgi:hypothetical protein